MHRSRSLRKRISKQNVLCDFGIPSEEGKYEKDNWRTDVRISISGLSIKGIETLFKRSKRKSVIGQFFGRDIARARRMKNSAAE